MRTTNEIRLYVKYKFVKLGSLDFDSAVLFVCFTHSKNGSQKIVSLSEIFEFNDEVIEKSTLELEIFIFYTSSLPKHNLNVMQKSLFERDIFIANMDEFNNALSHISVKLIDSKSAIISIDQETLDAYKIRENTFILSHKSMSKQDKSDLSEEMSDIYNGRTKKMLRFVDMYIEYPERERFTQNSDWMNKINILNDWNSLAKDDKADET